ncbi:DUF1501 domain-containing protein [Limnoglobus roseus]|uniref:DUF1501 domain-containing protein n=1 Tax=Limnoglobus roseus TaxID=2598579 RepID=A0A5C1APH9_9BACT|nr:DUF1501 domain-containing protein [Limnoglobus roseus]QEL19114.1 hypothetical protein PX52LOC_06171 [Limnoglobus roseus]
MFTRRELLQTTGSGFGFLAFSALAHHAAARDAAVNPLAPKATHFPAKAKRVLFLCMDGGPSHVDTFDSKPKLTADDGKSYSGGRGRFGGKLLGSPWKFPKQGQSGLPVSELFLEVGKHADELCLLNGMHTDIPNHPQAFLQMHCGLFQFPRPSLGAWVLYGLGTANENLPGFVTISPPTNNGGPANYGSNFLPAIYQGTRIGGGGGGFFGGGTNVSNIRNPRQSVTDQRAQLDFTQSLNKESLAKSGENPAVDGLIESYELAFRMQAELPKAIDVSRESKDTLALYGIGSGNGGGGFGGGLGGRRGGGTDGFGRQCLMARKLLEAGVRFVEITKGGWDQHRNLKEDLANNCEAIDRPIAGLLTDLKQRGLLKDTLVIWGGEFGRTPYAQGTDGRDHNSKGFTIWMAGGGVKGGHAHGRTDDYGHEAVEGKVHVHDWHATVLHLLGLDHEKLTYRHAGRDFRLTDVKGNVVKEIVA